MTYVAYVNNKFLLSIGDSCSFALTWHEHNIHYVHESWENFKDASSEF